MKRLRRWARGKEDRQQEEATRQTIQHANEVADRVQRMAQWDKEWDRLRGRGRGA